MLGEYIGRIVLYVTITRNQRKKKCEYFSNFSSIFNVLLYRDPNDMHEIRQMIGVCPQQDVLFDLLTVKEHLQFFASIKVTIIDKKQMSIRKKYKIVTDHLSYREYREKEFQMKYTKRYQM